MTLSLSRTGTKIRVTRSDSPLSPHVVSAELIYDTSTDPNAISGYITHLDGSKEPLSQYNINQVTIEGVVISDQTVFDTQMSLLFPNTNSGSGGSVVYSVNSIAEMLAYTGTSNFIAVLGGKDYGLFAASSASLVNDNGTIYAKSGGGHWLRQFDRVLGINPCWWGAQGDRVTDDIEALEATVLYAITNKVNIKYPSGVYRITRQLVVGYKYLGEEDMWNRNFTLAPSFDAIAYGNARFCEHISLIGDSNATIWGDFDSAGGDEAVVYYGIIGGGNSASRRLQAPHHGFIDMTIVGQDAYTGSDYTPAIPDGFNNQIALCVPRAQLFLVTGCSFGNTKIGLYGQDIYQSNISNNIAGYCVQGSILIGHNAAELNNNSFQQCTAGLYLQGAAVVLNNTWCNNCSTGIQVGGSSIATGDNGSGTIEFNGVYCENDIVGTYDNVSQFIIGGEDDDPDTEVTGVVIKVLSGATGNRGMMLLQNCKQVTIEGSSITTEPVVTTFSKNIIISTSANRPLELSGPGTVYYRDDSISASQFKLSALNTAPATSSSTGELGEIRIDANFVYVCTATNTWVRSPLATF